MTGATVASTTATYAYDGEDTRVGKFVATTPTTYIWDRESGLPLLVDDGTNGYLHAGGVVGEIASTTREDLLGDGLGSVRGVSDGAGVLTGNADFDAYGATRASSGSAAGFAFTGEQSDPETGFTYLRARYLDPGLGRFGAVDTVMPNAAGTQGYNGYSYAAANPTTWVDPSGHSATGEFVGLLSRTAGAQAGGVGLVWLGLSTRNLIFLLADVFAAVATGYGGPLITDHFECTLFKRNCPSPPPCVAPAGTYAACPGQGSEGGGGSGSGSGGGGGSTGPFPPNGFPPGNRNIGAACEAIVDVLSVGTAWVKTYANPAGDVVRFTSPDGKWEMELELKPSKNTTTQTGPRFRIRELGQGPKAIQQPFIDPWTGERGIRDSRIAHIPLLGDMALCAAKIATLFP